MLSAAAAGLVGAARAYAGAEAEIGINGGSAKLRGLSIIILRGSGEA